MIFTSKSQARDIREEASRVLGSDTFRRAGRVRDLFRYLADHAGGDDGELKESVLAVEVFRRDDHDPKLNSIVRMTAANLRRKLADYYSSEGRLDPLHLSLPKGTYRLAAQMQDAPPAAALSRRWWIGAAGMTALAATGAIWCPTRVSPPAPGLVAVLPFRDTSEGGTLDWLGDSLSDELIDVLARDSGVGIVARTSAYQFRNRQVDIREVGGKLGARTVVEGTVQRIGERVRIRVQVIDSATGSHLWAEAFEGELKKFATLQAEVARGVASVVAPALRKVLAGMPSPSPDLDSYRRFLRARFLAARGGAGNYLAAIEELNSVIASAPDFAPAHLVRARSYLNLALTGPLHQDQATKEARRSLVDAQRLNSAHWEAYHVEALLSRSFDWNWKKSEFLYRKAIAASPGNPDSYSGLSMLLLFFLSRHDEAVACGRRAVTLDPLSTIMRGWLAHNYFLQRNYPAALAEARTIIDLNPRLQHGYVSLSFSHYMMKNYKDAAAAAEQGIRLADAANVQWLGMLASIYADWGKAELANHTLKRIDSASRTQHVSPMVYARVYIALGDHSKTLDALERGFQQRDPLMPWTNADPRFDPIRLNPRFRTLIAELQLV